MAKTTERTKRIESLSKDMSIYQFVQEFDSFDFGHPMQRNFVYSDSQASWVIYSVLKGYPIGNIEVNQVGEGKYVDIDGKQRATSLHRFAKDELVLTNDVIALFGVELAGKKLSQLPKQMQQDFINATVGITVMKDMTEAEVREMFGLRNNGTALSNVEKSRRFESDELQQFLNDMAKEPFFAEHVAMSPNQRRRFGPQTLIKEIMTLITESGIGFGQKEMTDFTIDISARPLSKELKDIIIRNTYYLNEVFSHPALKRSELNKMLKKAHVPGIFMLVNNAVEQEVTKEQFLGWALDFFTKRSNPEYTEASSNGVNSYSQIKKRLSITLKDFNAKMKNKDKRPKAPALPPMQQTIDGKEVAVKGAKKSASKKAAAPKKNNTNVKKTTTVKSTKKPAATTKETNKQVVNA